MPDVDVTLAARMRDDAWQMAIHERAQRDQVTQRIRFGLVVLNGASLATVLGASSLLDNLPDTILAFSASSFALGIAAAGWALESHQNYLIASAGRWSANAMKRERLRALIEFSHVNANDEKTLAAIEKLFNEMTGEPEVLFQPDTASIWKQYTSRGLWVVGMLSIVGYKIWSLI
ncbi:hypothetical protein [Sphingosinicella soli]|uniref:SMODS and SLOG-associating 2TM effector domain-containing protein n=1 Tax=Sphingosinicella soli TaxID=333708 RepID=A0A7W7B385_9SPHN|nr:hypothetical protein [Sphingosinicella soli]MBB4633204.1 hypothetical protein [Sphingosinicella soli]